MAESDKKDLKAQEGEHVDKYILLKPEDPPENYVLEEGQEATSFTKLSGMC